ncbi:hypothetical protein ACGCYP_06790 [Streptococcus mutans]|uniref:hypothetical protein n=3 Tax=Streptococcus mutans TaxID=1309 RepID=UPI00037F3B6F|nr:hypothetical protein [Streptococcus mutans]MCB4977175.1 hypothetical protein [Streptococcus mutans]SQF49512.1 Uncharacterised protein [Streptococcus mutans]
MTSGLRYLTEATPMALVAAKMAKENAKVEDLVPERSGVVVATNLSSMSTIVDFSSTFAPALNIAKGTLAFLWFGLLGLNMLKKSKRDFESPE